MLVMSVDVKQNLVLLKLIMFSYSYRIVSVQLRLISYIKQKLKLLKSHVLKPILMCIVVVIKNKILLQEPLNRKL